MPHNQSTIIKNYDNDNNDEIEFDSYNCDQKRHLIRILNATFPIIWLILGTLTNLLSIIVFRRKSMRNKSTFVYLTLMALTDLFVVLLGSMRDYLANDHEIFINGVLLCRVHVFLFFLTCQFSSWLLVAANLDRFLIVAYHFKFKMWCTKEKAFKIAIGIFSILVLINFHFLLFIDSSNRVSFASNTSSSLLFVQINPIVYPDCTITTPKWYIQFYTTIYCWIDSFIFSFIPFFIIIICNLTLIKKVNTFKRLKTKNRLNHRKEETQIQNDEEICMHKVKQNETGRLKTNEKLNTNPIKNMAVTLMGVTALFIIFTVPINIYIPIVMFSHDETVSKNSNCNKVDLVFTILNNMVNGNHSINFFIYYFTNTRFKNEMNLIVSKIKSRLVISCCS
jgi:hypothetical protein